MSPSQASTDEVLAAIDDELEDYVEWHPGPTDFDAASWAADGSHEDFRPLEVATGSALPFTDEQLSHYLTEVALDYRAIADEVLSRFFDAVAPHLQSSPEDTPPELLYATTSPRTDRWDSRLVFDEAQNLPVGGSWEYSDLEDAVGQWPAPLFWVAANPQPAPLARVGITMPTSLESASEPTQPLSRRQRRSTHHTGVDAQRSPYGPQRTGRRNQ